jgi:hypothetical protein
MRAVRPTAHCRIWKTRGIYISGNGDLSVEALQPLYLDDHMLVIEPVYCLSVSEYMEKLFTGICDAAPFPEPVFEWTPTVELSSSETGS